MKSFSKFLESSQERDKEVIHTTLSTIGGGDLLDLYKKLYKKEFDVLQGRTKLIDSIKKKIYNYRHLYSLLHEGHK